MLNSSGGFSTPNISSSSMSEGKTTISFSSPIMISSSSQRHSNSSIFLLGDEEPSLSSSQLTNLSFDRTNPVSEDLSSLVSDSKHIFSSSVNIPQQSTIHSPSSQRYSTGIVRTAPLYISVYSTTSPIPIVKSTVSSSTPSTNNEESIFTPRSPSS